MTNTNGQLVELGKRLLVAAKNGELEIVKELLAATAPIAIDWLGNSPLHLAAQNGHTTVVETLLKHGVFVNLRSKMDRTALHFAAMEGHVDIIELLILRGADLQLTDMLRMTALHWAAERQHVAICETLLRHGASPCSPMNKFDKTPFDIASAKSENEALHELFTRFRARSVALARFDSHRESSVSEEQVEYCTEENEEIHEEVQDDYIYQTAEGEVEDDAEDELGNEAYAECALENVDSVIRFGNEDAEAGIEVACLDYGETQNTDSSSCYASHVSNPSQVTADEVNLVLSLPSRASGSSPTSGTSTLQIRVNTDDAMRFLNSRVPQIRRFLLETDTTQSPLAFGTVSPPNLMLTEAGRLVLDTLSSATNAASYDASNSCAALPRLANAHSQSPGKRDTKRTASNTVAVTDDDETDERYEAAAGTTDIDGVLSVS